MKQYWMHIKYSVPVRCDNPLWTLTKGAFRSVEAVYKAYERQAAAMGYEILEVIPVGKRNRLGCWPYHPAGRIIKTRKMRE